MWTAAYAGLPFVVYEIEPVTAVTRELPVRAYERNMVGYSLCDNQPVVRVAVIGQDGKFGIPLQMCFVHRQYIDAHFIEPSDYFVSRRCILPFVERKFVYLTKVY